MLRFARFLAISPFRIDPLVQKYNFMPVKLLCLAVFKDSAKEMGTMCYGNKLPVK